MALAKAGLRAIRGIAAREYSGSAVREPVVVPCGDRVTGHLEEVRSDGAEAMVPVESRVVLRCRELD